MVIRDAVQVDDEAVEVEGVDVVEVVNVADREPGTNKDRPMVAQNGVIFMIASVDRVSIECRSNFYSERGRELNIKTWGKGERSIN